MTITRQSYHFVSNWTVHAQLIEAEKVIHNVPTWRLWWRDLKSVNVIRETPNYVGSEFEGVWGSASGYKLHMHIVITAFEAGKSIAFDATGDLDGGGTWQFETNGQNTSMRIVWDVATTKTWMNIGAPILRPIFEYNHSLLMRRAEVSLNEYLDQRSNV